MRPTDRRTLLEALARAPETGDQARLRALELIDRLDERERAERPAPTADELAERFAEDLADDEERLARVAELYLETGLLTPLIEERAQELAAEMTRARFAAVPLARGGAPDVERTQDAPEAEDVAEEPTEPLSEPETASEPESVRRTHPLDEAAFRLMADDEPPRPSMLTRLRKSS